MGLSNVFNTHSVFYFYGLEHLAINMYFYIMEGLNNNELVYISMEPELYVKLTGMMNILLKNIKYRSVKDLILVHKSSGITGLKEYIQKLVFEAQEKGFSGIRYIEQPEFAIKETSLRDFQNWESNLTKVLQSLPFSVLCLYDMWDYIKAQEYIDNELIKLSIKTHSHCLYNLTLDDVTNRFKQCS